jgi:hypothetical protein
VFSSFPGVNVTPDGNGPGKTVALIVISLFGNWPVTGPVLIKATDVYGAQQNCQVKVADIGPLLVLKLNAFGGPSGRRLPKDAYDIRLTVTAFVDGPAAAIKGFRAEEAAANPAYKIARRVLENDFSDINRDGPIRAAEFLGQSGKNREQIRQDLVTLARSLLGI